MKRLLPISILFALLAFKGNSQTANQKVSQDNQNKSNSGTALQNQSSQSTTKKSKPLGMQWLNKVDLTRSNAFVENKGQFNNDLDWVDGKDILYREDEATMQVYFTKSGLVYKLFNKVKLSEKEWQKYAKENHINGEESELAKEKEDTRTVIKTSLVKMNWNGGNNFAELQPEGPTPYYFNYAIQNEKGILGNVTGYKKLIYHNIYPNIDIEYSIDARTGIKYSYILHPGADVSLIKMQYNGATLRLDENKNIILKNENGEITDHAPDTFTGEAQTEGNKISSSFKLLDNSVVSFELAGGNAITETTVIDPWTVGSPIPGFKASANDVAVDGANNVIIYGLNSGTGTDMLQKYTSAGALLWTLNLTTFAGYGAFQGDVIADNAGNIYTTIGLGSTTVGKYYNTVCINPAGSALVWGNTTPGTGTNQMYETWTLAFNCGESLLIQSGGGQYPPANTSADFNMTMYEPINAGNGAEGALQRNYNWGEVIDSKFGANGMLYHLTADSDINGQAGDQAPASTGAFNKIICVNPGTGYSTVFVTGTGFSFIDGDQKEPGSVGANHLGISCKYLYDMDGLTLQQRDMTTGALLGSVAIPGGSNVANGSQMVNGGIVFDKCGDVYVGSKNKVVEFSPTLAVMNTFGGLPGTVFDLTIGSNNEMYACGASSSSGATSFVAELSQPDCPDPIITSTNATCTTLGTATITANFCVAPYSYAWSDGQTTQTATGLAAGSYTCIVTGSVNCPQIYSDTATVVITMTNGLTVTMGNPTNDLCNGGNNGSATVTVAGGTAPYTYAWTPNGGTNATGTGLTAGTYTCTVTDKNGCSGTATVTITQPALLVATMGVPTNVLCNGGNTGSATVTVAGGTGPYTYAWNPNGGAGATGTGLTAGTYTVDVTDNNGCTASATVVITQPPLLTATTSMTQSTCGQPNGTATVTAGGGTVPYTYSWNPSLQTTATATGLSAGTYTATVTDNNGCTATSSITVTSTPGITVTLTGNTNEVCNGGNTATATVSVVGGTAPYTYTWTPNGGTNATGTGLTAGTYTCSVTDNNGCPGTATVTITQPAAIVATMGVPTNDLCNGGNNGSATVTVAGGTGPYTYLWQPNGGTGPTGTGLSAGTYSVDITDNNGCTQTATVVITQPTAITIGITTVAANCGASNGTATATPAGGTGPYTYAWNPSAQTTPTATGLSAGTYTVTVTDNNGCTQTTTAIIANLNGETVTIGAVTNVSCFGGANGTAGTNVVGGTAPYTYAWTPTGGTGPTGTGLSAGIYTVTVTDANGCVSIANVTITQPTALVETMGNPTNVLCNGGTGSATVTETGGTGPYTYAWTPNGGAGATGTGLTAGTYTCTVTDNNGCTSTASVVITQPTLLTANITATNNVSCGGGSNGSLAVTALGGTNPYTYAWTPVGGTNAIANGLSAQSYTVVVTDNNGCTATAIGTITQPAPVTVTTTSTQTSCQPTGTATATPAGGTAPYTYSWNPTLQTNATATALSAGTYTVTVTDNNGCTGTATATVTASAFVTATMGAIVNVTCFGGTDGTATVTAANGTAPYTYAWTPTGGTNAAGTGLSAGTYTVTVTDNGGCTATATATIGQPTQIVVSASGPSNVCSGNTAVLNSIVSGGTLPYTYAWTPVGGNAATASVNPIVNTTYTLTVTDANGCTASTTVTVSVNPALSLIVTGPSAICPGGVVTLIASGSGGDGTYSYKWSNGSTSPSITVAPDSTTTYSVTLSDACGSNPVTALVTVTVDPLPNVRFAADLYQGCAPLCIQFRDLTTVTSGGIHGWLWTFGTGDSSSVRNPAYCYPNTGEYTVTLTVTSDSGCSSTLKILNMITVYSHPNANFIYTPDPVTIIQPQVQFYDKSTDQYGIAEWIWTFGDQSDSTSFLQNPTHNYTDTGVYCPRLEVMNIHGCVDTITECFDVQPLFTFYIPDAFSPNGDGLNDVFMPKGTYIKDYEMYIFDRWGMQLFHTTNILNGWPGTVKDGTTICQEDTYVYLINVTDVQGNKHSYTGKVSLIK